MPSSSPALLSPIMKLVMDLRPASVLDVGCGAGKWGALCREYLDWWGPGATGARRTRIDAVEIHTPYIGPLHRAVYDEVFCPRDAVDFLEAPVPDLGFRTPPERNDLILCVDVIEHLERERGLRFVVAAMKRTRTILISTPMVPSPQGAVFGNEHERHVSRWTPQDFEEFGAVSGTGVRGAGYRRCLPSRAL
jgi:2-polyprenyl-3-methyl-5-hydroxy-6-metoxy-1,4-benzoquinol methylase